MTSSESNIYFYDFSEGGFVSLKPTREVVIPTAPLELPHLELDRQKTKATTQISRYSTRWRSILGLACQLDRYNIEQVNDLREILIGKELPEPGMVDIRDGYYTGWFLAPNNKDLEQPVTWFRNEWANGDFPWPPKVDLFNPFFGLDEKNVTYWSNLIKNPLSLDQLREIARLPHEDSHPLFFALNRLSILAAARDTISFSEEVDKKTRMIEEKGDENDLVRFAQDHILRLSIAHRVKRQLFRRVMTGIKLVMKNAGMSVLPVDDLNAVVMYRTADSHYRMRALPIPLDKIDLFQRYIKHGENPLNYAELALLYRKYVDSTENLVPLPKTNIDKKSKAEVAYQKALDEKNYISALQLKIQREGWESPEYQVVDRRRGKVVMECSLNNGDKIIKVRVEDFDPKKSKRKAAQEMLSRLLN